MSGMPAKIPDPKVMSVWRITAFLIATAAVLCLLGIGLLLRLFNVTWKAGNLLLIIAPILYVAGLVVGVVILPRIRYRCWHYEVSDGSLQIAAGIFFHNRFVIPLARVQDTDVRQGPLLRAFGLYDVAVSTAAKVYVVPGLDEASANQLRDATAGPACMDREDV